MHIPNTGYKCKIRMASSKLQETVQNLLDLGRTCTISCAKESITLRVSGKVAKGSYVLRSHANPEKDDCSIMIDTKEQVEVNVALHNLNCFTKASQLSETVFISMSPPMPLVLKYHISDTSYLMFFLALKNRRKKRKRCSRRITSVL